MTFRRISSAMCVASLVIVSVTAARAATDSMQITTSYSFSAPAGTYFVGYSPSPDTSFITFTNTGTTTFVGTLADVAVSGMGAGADYSLAVSSWTLTPGQSTVFGTSPESSNVGGFNGPGGIVVEVNGIFSDGYSTGLWSVSDSNIHSGVINGGGLTDAFVLQGGCPTGCDYGDAIETAQAPGNYTFSHTSNVPEASTWAMMLLGFGGLGFVGYRTTRKQTAAVQA
jgi:PEP-CTERM motif